MDNRRLNPNAEAQPVINLTREQVNEIDESVAEYFFGCNISFRVVESPHFLKFVKKLNPNVNYKPPSRQHLADAILNRIFDKILRKNRNKLANSNSVLLLDGWKNSSSNTKHIVAFIHNTNDNSRVFLESFDVSSQSETAELLQNIVENCIDLARERYNTNIYAILTDNASPMTSMGNRVDIWNSTCNSHSGNLLAKDLVEPEYAKEVASLLKEFKSSRLELEIKNRTRRKISLPGDTRWCSYRDAFQSAVDCLPVMRQLVQEGIATLKETNNIFLMNPRLEANLRSYIQLWDPVCTLVNKCQKQDCTAADAVHLWYELLNNEILRDFRETVQIRINRALWPVAIAAYSLHPRYLGELLPAEKYGVAANFLNENLNEEGLRQFDKFINRRGIFQILYANNVESDPVTFWEMAQQQYPILSEFGLKLLNIPASTAQLERVFSNWAWIHNRLRNKLGSEKSKKLICIYYSMHHTDNLQEFVFPQELIEDEIQD